MQKLFKLLKKNEGKRLHPYYCTSDKITIGYGRNLADVGISDDEANFFLKNDVKRCIDELKNNKRFNKIFNQLSETRKIVFIDLIFNLGLNSFSKFKNFLHFCMKKEFNKASLELIFKNPVNINHPDEINLFNCDFNDLNVYGLTLYAKQVKGRAFRNAWIIKNDSMNFIDAWWSRGWV